MNLDADDSSGGSVLPLDLTRVMENKTSFSAPTSPDGLKKRHTIKAGELLGLSSNGVRRETLKVKKDVASRLQIDLESYNNYVSQTLAKAKKDDSASANSLLLTSEDIPLEVILSDPIHLKTFRMHAESNFCAESICFWERVNEFKDLFEKDKERASRMALNIWKNFLSPDAEVSLSARESVLVAIRQALDNNAVTKTMFDVVQQEAYSTMQFCLYPDYLCFLNASREGHLQNQQQQRVKNQVKSSRSTEMLLKNSTGLNGRKLTKSESHLNLVPSLRDCLTKPYLYKKFLEFAGTLRCAENVSFWQDVHVFQSIMDPDEIGRRASKIYETYLSASSSMELNISAKIRKTIRYELTSGLFSNTIFNEAQRDTYKLISLDVYPKFCQTAFVSKIEPGPKQEGGEEKMD